MSVSGSPFVRVQLNASTEIHRLDITLFLGRYIKGIFDIKVFQILINLIKRKMQFTCFGRNWDNLPRVCKAKSIYKYGIGNLQQIYLQRFK